jgi:hypothetical protein
MHCSQHLADPDRLLPLLRGIAAFLRVVLVSSTLLHDPADPQSLFLNILTLYNTRFTFSSSTAYEYRRLRLYKCFILQLIQVAIITIGRCGGVVIATDLKSVSLGSVGSNPANVAFCWTRHPLLFWCSGRNERYLGGVAEASWVGVSCAWPGRGWATKHQSWHDDSTVLQVFVARRLYLNAP